jgi:hypothetical protein
MRKIAALLVALVSASPAGGQSTSTDTPSIIPRAKPATFDHEGTFKGDVARATIDEFAACLLGRRRKPVLTALALPSGSLDQTKALGRIRASECIASGELHFSASIFRGSLYTALVRSQFGRKTPSLGPEPVDYSRQPPPGSETPIPEVAGLLNFASCVIHKDPESARDAIIATAGPPTEDAALAALAKVHGQCLYSDQTLRVSKGDLIGLLAEAYYRESNASVQGSAAR